MEFSDEMKNDLVRGLLTDCTRMQEQIQRMQLQYPSQNAYEFNAHKVDQLVYITEEMRLKLKLLGGARIYEL
jgi:hypothetical protein